MVNAYKNLDETKRELIWGPKSDAWNYTESDFNAENWEDNIMSKIFCYMTADVEEGFGFGTCCYLLFGTRLIDCTEGLENLRYLRPVVALDSKTTVNQVSVIGKIENPTWTWYDVCGKQAGS